MFYILPFKGGIGLYGQIDFECSHTFVSYSFDIPISLNGCFICRMKLAPFDDFNTALDKALGKLVSQPKQVM